MPEWTVKGGTVDASSGSVRFLSGKWCGISLPSTVHTGTWKLRYRWVNGAPDNPFSDELDARYRLVRRLFRE